MRLKGHWFEPHLRHCVVSLSKEPYPLLCTDSNQGTSQHDWKIVDWDVKNQLKQSDSIYHTKMSSPPHWD